VAVQAVSLALGESDFVEEDSDPMPGPTPSLTLCPGPGCTG